jgi:hypothetical protein
MRGAGCTINDMWDRDIDKKVSCTEVAWYHGPYLADRGNLIVCQQAGKLPLAGCCSSQHACVLVNFTFQIITLLKFDLPDPDFVHIQVAETKDRLGQAIRISTTIPVICQGRLVHVLTGRVWMRAPTVFLFFP